MNETQLTFKFHKVVRQQNSGAVEDFILPYSAVYLRIQKWKNYRIWNRSTFAKVIVKLKVAPFYGPRCILDYSGAGFLETTRLVLHCVNLYSCRACCSSRGCVLWSYCLLLNTILGHESEWTVSSRHIITRAQLAMQCHTITRKLSYHKDDRAMRPINGCPEKFR